MQREHQETQSQDTLKQQEAPAGASSIERLAEAVAAPSPAVSTAPAYALAQDPELIRDFIVESQEHLLSLEAQLLVLDQDADAAESIHSVFRSFHTIKGLAGFLELDDVREVAHEIETALDLVRQGTLRITPVFIDVLLAGADFLKQWLERLDAQAAGAEAGEVPPKGALLERVRRLASAPAGEPEAVAVTEESPAPEEAPAPNERPVTAAAAEAPAPGEAEARRPLATEQRSVKVDTHKLDSLVDLVGEMVIAQSLLRHDSDLAAVRSPRLLRNLTQLARATNELQKTAMSIRMVPIGALFQKMSRLTRDLARKFSKQVEVELSGEETELDRNLVEELADPLMHMIRNAVDHGIEPSATRVAKGKPPAGRLRLKAYHQAGNIAIEVSDDGKGLDCQKILAKAIEKGLVDGPLPDEEIQQLIFHPGFSTAEKVTDVSGRGVGMDVVRRQIEKLRGRIDIRSRAGEGTQFTFKLPLTLAILDGLVVSVGGERYIVPLFAVKEVVRPSEGMVNTVEGRAEYALVRERLMPVRRLYRQFRVTPKSEEPCESVMVISESRGKPYGLLVDELIGKQEVVIKNLGEALKNIPGVAGGAILGDGRVGLVLDLDGIFALEA
ncbi:MAG: chemotaxis protein CheA [Bryobacteraceae bacterium]|nr:chemotaxis protein CheA [Bryobacteraceae bacterium]